MKIKIGEVPLASLSASVLPSSATAAAAVAAVVAVAAVAVVAAVAAALCCQGPGSSRRPGSSRTV